MLINGEVLQSKRRGRGVVEGGQLALKVVDEGARVVAAQRGRDGSKSGWRSLV